eukprot:5383260-Alexandrium_andersonii.AAC.1
MRARPARTPACARARSRARERDDFDYDCDHNCDLACANTSCTLMGVLVALIEDGLREASGAWCPWSPRSLSLIHI